MNTAEPATATSTPAFTTSFTFSRVIPPSISIAKDSVTEKIYKSRQVKKDENGNEIELPKDQQGDEIWSKYEYEIVDIDCYYVEIKGNASGYVDDYNSDFNKMTFTYSAYFSKEDSAIFEEKLDFDWKY